MKLSFRHDKGCPHCLCREPVHSRLRGWEQFLAVLPLDAYRCPRCRTRYLRLSQFAPIAKLRKIKIGISPELVLWSVLLLGAAGFFIWALVKYLRR